MGDSIQQQLDRLLHLFLEEQTANKAHREEMNSKIEALSEGFSGYEEGHSSRFRRSNNHTSGASGSGTLPRFAKLDFPKFNGSEDPLGWLNRCEHFFRHQQTLDEEKVGLASYHLEGNAQLWFIQLMEDYPDPTWEDFKDQCNLRFGPPVRSNKLGELAKLKQTGTVSDYQTQFEILVSRAGALSQLQKVQLYISGLKEYIAVEVELHHPRDLATAMSMSRLYERKAAAFHLPAQTTNRLTQTPPGRQIKRLTREEMDERRRRGLCFNCDEAFTKGHQCKKLFWVELEEEDREDYPSEGSPLQEEIPEISLNAIMGANSAQTMRVKGEWQGHPVLILIDSGSTHSFVAAAVVSQLEAQVQPQGGLRVKVANGDQMTSPGVCKNVELTVGTNVIKADLLVLPLSGIDVVLGVNWLHTLGAIMWDFSNMQMKFKLHGKELELQGLHKAASNAQPSLHQLEVEQGGCGQLQALLGEFSGLFLEPTELPPTRSCDHRILLEPGTKPVAVRPYRYPHGQKDEIERQCSTMLNQGIIRPSHSPFSSPVILVPKADGSWRLCVDYRELNANTIKDKFPIPVIDELLEELGGARYFSKLDLRSGYHQVRMFSGDIEKTAFRTHHGHFEFLVMPFGLSNAPSTFQALMNDVFKDYLRKFVLVFFDDILVYSHSLQDHLLHLRVVFQLLAAHMLFLKQSKCGFAQTQIAYLGHVVTQEGVKADDSKIAAVKDWPQPSSIKGLRGFLGLTGYYRKFVHNYGVIASPLTAMLRKNCFRWTDEALLAFKQLKNAMISTPVLALPNFSQPFTVECDASETGIGAVLTQANRPIAYFSRPMASQHKKLPAYERELIGLVKAIKHWRSYLWGQHFVVKTDHYSLKFLLEQKGLSSTQQHWASKLLGFTFSIEYKAGKLNAVADALSRRDTEEATVMALSAPHLNLFDEIRREQLTSNSVQLKLKEVQEGTADPKWEFKQGLLFCKGRVFVPHESPSAQVIIGAIHNQGHEGYQKSLFRITRDFYWSGMKQQIRDFVKGCDVCQRHKTETLQPAGLLQPLPVPQQIWADVSLDFVEGLPKSRGKDVILVVVDRFSKFAHFLPLSHPYTAVSVARIFFDHIFKLHGLPETLVSDRDVTFTSLFWTELFRLSGTKLAFTSAYHPQSDGQTEVVNKIMNMYLRCFTSEHPTRWTDWLAWAEYCYNTSYHSALRATPFEVVYGRTPPRLLNYIPGTSRVDAVDQALQTRDMAVSSIRANLLLAQQRMKHSYDRRHRDLEFDIGDRVLLRLQPYRHLSLAHRRNQKLSARFYGPFTILKRIGKVAYELDLPPSSRIHPVFHVSLLKKYHAEADSGSSTLPPVSLEPLLRQPLDILDTRIRDGQQEVLVHWQHSSPADASWELLTHLQAKFPELALEDKCQFNGGSDVMKPLLQYKRHTHGKYKTKQQHEKYKSGQQLE